MVEALWITLIGMGLVFVAILLLWGLMALIVRITAEPEEAEEEQEADAFSEQPTVSTPKETGAVTAALAVAIAEAKAPAKARAAAAAVAAALALHTSSQPERPAGQGSVSAWQAVNRANQISQRMNSSRKKVVR